MEHIATFPKLLNWIGNRSKAHVYLTSRADVWRRLLGFLRQGVPNSFRFDVKPFFESLLRVVKNLARNPTYAEESLGLVLEFVTLLFDEKYSSFFSPSYTRTFEFTVSYLKFVCSVVRENTLKAEQILLLNDILFRTMALYTRICVIECNGKRTFSDVLSKLFNRLGEVRVYWEQRSSMYPAYFEKFNIELKSQIGASMTNVDSIEALVAPLENYVAMVYEDATGVVDEKRRPRRTSSFNANDEEQGKQGNEVVKTTGQCVVEANAAFDIKLRERIQCLDAPRAFFPIVSYLKQDFQEWMVLFRDMSRVKAMNKYRPGLIMEITEKRPEIVSFLHVFSILTHLGEHYTVEAFSVAAVFLECVFSQIQHTKQVSKEETRAKRDKAEFLASQDEVVIYLMLLQMALFGTAPSTGVKFECVGMLLKAASTHKTYHALTDFSFRTLQASIFDAVLIKTGSTSGSQKYTVSDKYNVFLNVYVDRETSYATGLGRFYMFVMDVMPELFISRLQSILMQIGCGSSNNDKDNEDHLHSELLSHIFAQVVKLRASQSVLETYLDSAEHILRIMTGKKQIKAHLPRISRDTTIVTEICQSLSHTGKLLQWEKFHLLFQGIMDLGAEYGGAKLRSTTKALTVFGSRYRDAMEDLLFIYHHLLASISPLPELDNQPLLIRLQKGNDILKRMIKMTVSDCMYSDNKDGKAIAAFQTRGDAGNADDFEALMFKPKTSLLNLTTMAMFSNSLVNLALQQSKSLLGELSGMYPMLLGSENAAKLNKTMYVSHFCHLQYDIPLSLVVDKYVFRKKKQDDRHAALEKALQHSAALRLKYMALLHPTLFQNNSSNRTALEKELAKDCRMLSVSLAMHINNCENDDSDEVFALISNDQVLFHTLAALRDSECDHALVRCVSNALVTSSTDNESSVLGVGMLEYAESADILGSALRNALGNCVDMVFSKESLEREDASKKIKWISNVEYRAQCDKKKGLRDVTSRDDDHDDDDNEEEKPAVKKSRANDGKCRKRKSNHTENSDDEASEAEIAPFPQDSEQAVLDEEELNEEIKVNTSMLTLLRNSSVDVKEWDAAGAPQLPCKPSKGCKAGIDMIHTIFSKYATIPYHLRNKCSNAMLPLLLGWHAVLTEMVVLTSTRGVHAELKLLQPLVELAVQSSVQPPDHKVSTVTGSLQVASNVNVGLWGEVPTEQQKSFFSSSSQTSLFLALLLSVDSSDKRRDGLLAVLEKKPSENELLSKLYKLTCVKKRTVYSMELLHIVCSRLPKNCADELLEKLNKYLSKTDMDDELFALWKHAALGQICRVAGAQFVTSTALLDVVRTALASPQMNREHARICLKILGSVSYSALNDDAASKHIFNLPVPALVRLFFTAIETLSLCISKFGCTDFISLAARRVVAGLFLRCMSVSCVVNGQAIGSNVILGMILQTIIYSMDTDYNEVGMHAYWTYSRFPCSSTYSIVLCDIVPMILSGITFASATDVPSELTTLGVIHKGALHTFFAFVAPIFGFMHTEIVQLANKVKTGVSEQWNLSDLCATRTFVQSVLPATLNVEELGVTYERSQAFVPSHTAYLDDIFLLNNALQCVGTLLTKSMSFSLQFDHVLLCLVALGHFFTASSTSSGSDAGKECFFYCVAYCLFDEYANIVKALASHHAGVIRRHYMSTFVKQVIILLTHLLKWGDKYRRVSPGVVDEQIYALSRVLTFVATPEDGNVLLSSNRDLQRNNIRHAGVFVVHILRAYVNLCKNPVVALTGNQQQLLQASMGHLIRTLDEKYIVEVAKQQDDLGKTYLEYLITNTNNSNKLSK